MPEINIPFSGFYDSWWSDEIDQCLEREAEWMAEKDGEEQPKELRLDSAAYADMLFDCAEFSDAFRSVAQAYCERFDSEASERIGVALNSKFAAMDSPKYYNFETDRLFVEVPDATVAALFAKSAEESHETLRRLVDERHKSRDGFISFYKSDASVWLDKPVSEWDCNELGTLLAAVMEASGECDDIEMDIYQDAYEDCSHAFSDCVDWPKFEAQVADAREDLREEAGPDF